MKATVEFYENGKVIKTETFRTKKEARLEIQKYIRKYTVHQKVVNKIEAHISN